MFQMNAQAPATQTQSDNWKATGFINLYLPTADGGRRKLGSIPLKDARPAEAALVKQLEEDPSYIAKVAEKLEIEYNSAKPKEGSQFALD